MNEIAGKPGIARLSCVWARQTIRYGSRSHWACSLPTVVRRGGGTARRGSGTREPTFERPALECPGRNQEPNARALWELNARTLLLTLDASKEGRALERPPDAGFSIAPRFGAAGGRLNEYDRA